MNYTTLSAALVSWCENSSTEFAAQISNFVQLAELRIARECDLDVFRKYATATLTSGTAFLAKPADCFVVRQLSYTDVAGAMHLLLQKDDTFLKEFWPNRTSTGTPRFYANWGYNTFLIAPTPSSGLAVELAYTYRPTSIVTAATSWLGDNASDLLLAAAMLEALAFEKGEAQAMAPTGPSTGGGLWQQKYEQAKARVMAEQDRIRTDQTRSGER